METFLTTIGLYVLPALALFALLVFIHELGHYLAARYHGVGVKTFAIGMGPRLGTLKRDQNGTQWKLAALPLGGYVELLGGPGDKDCADVEGKPLSAAGTGARISILAAGPIANILLAGLLFMLFIATADIARSPSEIAAVEPGSPAAEAGLHQGDRILAVNGRDVRWMDQVLNEAFAGLDREIALIVERDGRPIDVTLHPDRLTANVLGRDTEAGYTGIQAAPRVPVRFTPAQMLAETADMFVSQTRMTVQAVKDVVTGHRGVESLMSIVGITHVTGEMIQLGGLTALVYFAGTISLALAVMNLLPLPVLDGGQIVIAAGEKLVGRRVPEKAHTWMARICMGLLIALTVYLAHKDLTVIGLTAAGAGVAIALTIGSVVLMTPSWRAGLLTHLRPGQT
ncbi:hypothetical protein CKO28_09035 [Rhodovibrio sodomensis]|uniref:PDZ domain-containing protein n=2 Tax=Rhodovibrio sodomensis TaxID=1088 RepID=A0ABS1DFJ6_9PROT|nr:M50 family metallopeptidase [Rhodovibrio sodomensis]MBK1668180.1 hypothetical protein [Rhodovibrio sodomensis]